MLEIIFKNDNAGLVKNGLIKTDLIVFLLQKLIFMLKSANSALFEFFEVGYIVDEANASVGIRNIEIRTVAFAVLFVVYDLVFMHLSEKSKSNIVCRKLSSENARKSERQRYS